jgi:hypothetical protein
MKGKEEGEKEGDFCKTSNAPKKGSANNKSCRGTADQGYAASAAKKGKVAGKGGKSSGKKIASKIEKRSWKGRWKQRSKKVMAFVSTSCPLSAKTPSEYLETLQWASTSTLLTILCSTT